MIFLQIQGNQHQLKIIYVILKIQRTVLFPQI